MLPALQFEFRISGSWREWSLGAAIAGHWEGNTVDEKGRCYYGTVLSVRILWLYCALWAWTPARK